MSDVWYTVDNTYGLLVKLGLGQPSARAVAAGAVASLVAYGFKFPTTSFRRDGTMKPMKALSAAPDATNTHFLLVPVTAATVAYLFT